MKPRRRRMRYEMRIVVTALVAVVPLILALFTFLLVTHARMRAYGTVAFLAAISIFTATYLLHERLVYPLRTLANLISALREEDYTLRARELDRGDVLGEALIELDALRNTIEERKLEAIEATALLRAVLGEIDAAIFTFDPEQRLRLVNRAGEKLLDKPSIRLIGRTAAEIGLGALMHDDAPAIFEQRWSVRRSMFRQGGLPHTLLFLTDIGRELREEEAEAWRRIVRVLSHELNNSLAPIQSIAESTARLVAREPLPDDWRDDAASGLRVISSRSEALTRFIAGYAQLARLPQPRKRPVDLGALVHRVAALETRIPVVVDEGPRVTIDADEDQLEQLLINVLKNAVEASLETAGSVCVTWSARGVQVLDEGPGLAATANLFVPFFTTKPNGNGIGLVLVRQIADVHGAAFTLQNRRDRRGCVATLTLAAK